MNNFIVSILFQYSKTKADTIAIQDSDGFITYGQLWCKIQKISKRILEQTAGVQMPVIIWQERNSDFIVSMLSCLVAGAIYIPVVKETPVYRIERIIEDSKCCLMLVDEELPCSCIKQINVKTGGVYNISAKVVQDNMWKRYSELAYIMYTSGTTGNPKGVIIKLSNLQNLVLSFGEIVYNEIKNTVRVAVLASFGFDSSVKQIYSALYYGHTLVIASEKEKHFSKLLQNFYLKNDIYISDGTPSNMRILISTRRKICNHVKYYIIGGENFMAEIAKKMFEIHENPIDIIDVYGPTECCVDVSYYKVDREKLDGGFIPIGSPILNTKLNIVDEKGNIISRKGEKGELVVLGKQVGAGYTSGENDKFTFGLDIYDNTYHTGDVAVLNDCGQIVVLGRVDNQVKKNGYRIELDEIAIQIKEIDKIKNVVIRKKNYNDAEKIVAFIVSDKRYLEKELLEEVTKVVPKYMVPDIIIQMEEIPTNINGKVDEKKMDEYYETYKMLKEMQ